MLPPNILDQLNSARQAKIDASNAEANVAAAKVSLENAQSRASEADSSAASSRQAALDAVTAWMDSPINTDANSSSPTSSNGADVNNAGDAADAASTEAT